MAPGRLRLPSARAREAAELAAGSATASASTSTAASTSSSGTATTATKASTSRAHSHATRPSSRNSNTTKSLKPVSRPSRKGKNVAHESAAGGPAPEDDEQDEQVEQVEHDAGLDLDMSHRDDDDDDEDRKMHVDRTSDEDDDDDESEDDATTKRMTETDKEPDLTLYCICLGFAGDRPMVQCDHCSNWFHFSCVGITDKIASSIEAYCCDICRDMGIGVTRYSTDPNRLLKSAENAEQDEDDEDSEEENDDVFNSENGGIGEEEIDGSEPDADEWIYSETTADHTTSSSKRNKVKEPTGATREKKKAKIEKDQTAEVRQPPMKKRVPKRRTEYDADFIVGDNEDINSKRSNAKAVPVRTSSTSNKDKPSKSTNDAGQGSPTPTPVDPANVRDAPATDKVRSHVVKQLYSFFLSIFSTSVDLPPEFKSNEDRATAFATEVEADLFENFAEIDAKANVRAPRTKYSTKFRSLHYNLKTNAGFRSKISSNELTPIQIVGMSNEDLLRPELKAMAETVRAASLKHSVKEVIGAPTAKRTHKGEEEIDAEAGQRLLQEEEKAFIEYEKRNDRDRSASISESGHLGMSPRAISPGTGRMSPAGSRSPRGSSVPQGESWSAAGARETSPVLAMSPPPVPSSSSRRHRDSISSYKGTGAQSPKLGQAEDETKKGSGSPIIARRESTGAAGSPIAPFLQPGGSGSPLIDSSPFPVAAAPKPRQRSSFDMASVWGKVKASPKAESEEPQEEGQDPLTSPSKHDVADHESDDDFEAELFGNAVKGKARKVPRAKSVADLVDSLTAVWNGDLFVPDEGGFPAFAVQIGGRSLGVDRRAWSQIIPARSLTTGGRLATAQAHKYLLDCWSAPSRELIVLAIMPDLSGPTPEQPARPSKERCLAKHQHVVDFYVSKDRIGVVPPPSHMKGMLKDFYIVPLKQEAPLPDFVQILDESVVPKNRESDLLLAVLVVTKNSLPTVAAPPPLIKVASASATSTASVSSPSATPRAIVSASPISNREASTTPLPTTAPAATPLSLPSTIPGLDAASLASLSSLLSNPSLIQSALASVSSAPSSTALPAPPPGLVPPSSVPSTVHQGGNWSPSSINQWSTAPSWNDSRGSTTPQYPSSNANRDHQGGGYSPLPSTTTTGGGGGNQSPISSSSTSGIHPSRLGLISDQGSAAAGAVDGGLGPKVHPSRLGLLTSDSRGGGDRAGSARGYTGGGRGYDPSSSSSSGGGGGRGGGFRSLPPPSDNGWGRRSGGR